MNPIALMEAELDEKSGESCQNQRMLQTEDRPHVSIAQKIFLNIVQEICKAQHEYSLHFTLEKEDALLVIESLYADAQVERANT